MNSHIITFRTAATEFAQISAHAARAGLTISGAVRALVFASLDDRPNEELLRRLNSIDLQLGQLSSTAAASNSAQLEIIKQAMAGLVEQHFLPVSEIGRKQQIREILALLKA